MSNIQKIFSKKTKLIIGVLSGTSVDALDIVLIRVNGFSKNINFEILAYHEYKIPDKLKDFILKVSDANTGSTKDVCNLNFLLGKFYADKINDFLKKTDYQNDEIDAIGSHGQTIHHLPDLKQFLKYRYKSTLQIGDPSVIANLTGIITVGDFRNADVALNGGGAPLVPFMDYNLFGNDISDRILLNIGGISNITFLKRKGKLEDILAFDTGPGNMLIDFLSKKLFDKRFDKDCNLAKKGFLNEELLKKIIKYDKYLKIPPPKSTGREYYNENFIYQILDNFTGTEPNMILRTFTEYTSYAIAYNIKKFLKLNRFDLLISGGGAKNYLVVDALKKYLPNANISEIEYNGINKNNKEAVLFALLANETLNSLPSNIPSVTGANKRAILGKICLV